MAKLQQKFHEHVCLSKTIGTVEADKTTQFCWQVGKNLHVLSQLEGVDLEMYREVVLPRVLEQVRDYCCKHGNFTDVELQIDLLLKSQGPVWWPVCETTVQSDIFLLWEGSRLWTAKMSLRNITWWIVSSRSFLMISTFRHWKRFSVLAPSCRFIVSIFSWLASFNMVPSVQNGGMALTDTDCDACSQLLTLRQSCHNWWSASPSMWLLHLMYVTTLLHTFTLYA